jgi:purine-binding chemotaxis protein CheW
MTAARRPTIDWNEARNRVRRNTAAIEAALAETPERIETAYRARAALLARASAAVQPAAPGVPTLVAVIGAERYAIELHELAEVLPFVRCTKVPGAPPIFRGVLNIRGELRTVVDLGRLVSPSAAAPDDSGVVLMVRRPGRELGLHVDRVDELRELRSEELESPAQPGFAKGYHAGAMILVLAVDAVLERVFSKQEFQTE